MEQMSPETRARIEDGLANWGNPNHPVYQRFLAARKKWDRVLQPMVEAIERSERLTADDLRIIINI